MMKEVALMLLLHISLSVAQPDGTLLIFSPQKNRCLGDNLQELDVCDPQNPRQQFRWTSENRIFNVAEKKCLGTGSKSEGSKLQWYICDANSDLQKWECQSNSLFGLKNESLYLSVQDNSNAAKLSRNPGEKGKWTIHGTLDSVCSQPYEEIYTLKGNAAGLPCHFPFRYNNTWYTDCTAEGRSSNLAWCSVEPEYEPNQLWGYCPTQQIVQQLWRKNPLTEVYYQVNENAMLTWYQARKSCQQQGGDLLSITEPHEQTFISGLTRMTDPVLWTGLNSLDASSGWRWVNGQPLRYLKWLSGQPSSLPGYSCGVLSPLYGSEWSTAVCSEKLGYICQKGLPTPTVPPVVPTGSCHSPWIPYSGHCYLLSRTKRTWMEARDACRHEGGDLLSVLNVEEQSFTISQLGYSQTDELWIGFSYLTTTMLFEWSDHSSVPFALWDVNEPSHNAALKEDCVIMRGEEGKWADQTCDNNYGYICKKKALSSHSEITSPGCKAGWVRYGYYCYQAGSETKTFEEAKMMCEKTGSYLVDVSNRYENAFLVSLIGARAEKHFWIGLSNEKIRHIFQWTNAKKVSFTHFNVGMPGSKQGCVAMTTGVLAGLWDVLSCTNAEKYICKQKAEGVITTPAPPTTPDFTCRKGWEPVPDRDLCFKLFEQGNSKKKTWSEALDFCRELGGDLLSIHDAIFNGNLRLQSRAWIGYSIQDPSVGYTWSDGSSSSYENWKEGEPNNLHNVEKCAAVSSMWTRKTEWCDLQCAERHDWFCEIKKGVTPKEVNIISKTYNKTDDGWIIFKDNQYYINRGSYDPMVVGRSFCRRRRGDLVSITDEEERVFLWHQFMEKQENFFIGMYIDLDSSLSWMDGSPVVFQAWTQNQPTFLYGEENCVRMTWYHGLWESVNCGNVESGFICKRSGSVPAHATAAPTEAPKGGCPPDWVKFQEKCFRIGLDMKTWDDARLYCRSLGGTLASVTSRLQQAFLTLKITDGTPDLWLGFSTLPGRILKWVDGSPNLFSAWASYTIMNNLCIAMGGIHNGKVGKWLAKDCNHTSGYVCNRAIDHSIIPSPTEVPKTFIKLGNSSYMLVQTNMTWKEAQSHCETVGANLASIRDNFAKSYIDLQTYSLGQPLWIGLNSMKTHGYYLWADNWHLRMEQWAPNEPKRDHPCVYVDVDGMWKSAQCNQTYYSLCKKSTDIAPPSPTQYPGVCPEPSSAKPRMIWLPFREHCYAFTNSAESWYTASHICKIRGGELASIVDMKEAEFIENNIRLRKDLSSYFWIGLYKSQREHWLWIDNSVVDYINWAESEKDSTEYVPVYSYGRVRKKNCAVISARTSQWEKHDCSVNLHSYICKTAKVVRSTTKPTPTGSAGKALRPFSGVSVAVLIAALCVLTGLVYGYYRSSRKQASTYENSMQDIREGLVQEDEDTRGLVSQIERNEEAPAL
ncbi:macrophage mannose receptor 1-like [Salminus brasiliensis]|uniref:macrophage mannose receptor 1-like n=1 Tax=Salminus brasiliensis TaxID=930266 RepID=UPI003B830585